jgi:hypothetical protein
MEVLRKVGELGDYAGQLSDAVKAVIISKCGVVEGVV